MTDVEVALFPKDCSPELAAALVEAGVSPVPLDALDQVVLEAAGEWSVLVLELGEEPMRRLRRLGDILADTGLPVLVVAEPSHLGLLEGAEGVSDLITAPPQPMELGWRLQRLRRDTGEASVLRYGDLELNLLTYQASLDGRPVDLTYMEYELLRFLVENQGRVWSREQLLSKVWGYDYFGGARTVDVHVRRLRAKLGEERAGWITTVRSVGYRFG